MASQAGAPPPRPASGDTTGVSEENVEIIRRSWDHLLACGEPDWKTTGEDVEIHDHDIPDRGEYRGHAGVRQWFEDWGAAWAEWSFRPLEFIDAGDHVVVLGRVTATGRDSGVKVDRQDGIVYEIRDGKIVRLDYFNSRDQALEAAGLSTQSNRDTG